MPARKKTAARKQTATRKQTSSRKQASSRKSSASRGSPDAIALLKADHELVQGLFDKFEKTRGDDRKAALAEQICNELKVHTQIEEEIFYPAAREAIGDEDLMNEATVEHQGAKDLIAQIEGGKGDELFDAKVTVLGEYIKHHVKEEHTEMFPKVRKTKLDLRALGERMKARKDQLKSGAAGRGAKSELSGSRRSSGGNADQGRKHEPESIMSTVARELGFRKG